MLRSRRRSSYGAYGCAVISALLLLLSVSLLYSRLSLSPSHNLFRRTSHSDSLLSDSRDEDDDSISAADDRIDELDIVEEQQQDDDFDDEGDALDHQIKVSGYFFDPLSGSIRRAFNRPRSIEEWDGDDKFGQKFLLGAGAEDRCKAAFGSDDVAVDEEVRRKATQVTGIEDALLLKMGGKRGSPLREGWGDWFDKKGVFLRKDRMFKSNWDVLNPMNNPMLQDPDAVGVTGLTRGDRIVQKWWMNEFKRVPFLGKKILDVSRATRDSKLRENYNKAAAKESNSKNDNVDAMKSDRESRGATKGAERRTLNDHAANGNTNEVGTTTRLRNVVHKGLDDSGDNGSTEKHINHDGALTSADRNSGTKKYSVSETRRGKSVDHVGERDHIYADGNIWGYYPGLPLHLTFTDFMDAFFRMGKCDMRVFMVWNSPPWMYSVRHQRGLESLLFHHRGACVVVFSETIELDFFKDNFVNDGYKVAVAMPNLDELLKDTPTHIFSSVWFEWRKTKFYSTHYSELIRLAALYKYGGIYLDSDIIVLKPISFLNNSVGMEDHIAGSALNGAVMAFERQSLFIKECLEEFYLTYDDTSLRWNGADLLTRVAKKFLGEENKSIKRLKLKVEPSYIFFPISSQNITRYFIAPATEAERAQQDVLLKKILHESLTFHFWNSLTSSLIPEPGSLVTRLMNYPCIRCLELL